MDKIFEEIKQERKSQDEQWGGEEHDDNHNEGDWEFYINNFASGLRGDLSNHRKRMVKVAALAVAAIQSYDRINI